ncbi:hypothetical protein [Pseudomonas sp. OF001]|uniref:hypothetical protein n=1 Tax=Pseudomonas sp. OF001 TaxID=2772300 RepID=UPI002E2E4FEE|nr:hypothetical protein [Pseudomonas sp. OF001]
MILCKEVYATAALLSASIEVLGEALDWSRVWLPCWPSRCASPCSCCRCATVGICV